MASRGFFIVVEGIDGSGKDTHIRYLSDKLQGMGYNVLKTAEPSRNQVGNFLRIYQRRNEKRIPAETEALLFAADRYNHVKNVIEPAIKRGHIVLSNRYYYSTLAYQGSMGVDLDWIREINRFAPRPDLAVLLDILPEYSLQRLKRKTTIFEDVANLRRVRNIYMQLVEAGELISVDADRPRRLVQEELLSIVKALIEAS
jgi:dTMP kinase